MKVQLFCGVYSTLLVICHCTKKQPVPYNETRQSPKHDNPNFIRDRYKWQIRKPELPEWWTNRYRLPFHPSWMDYCAPYKCNDYHKIVCGLNRKKMKFQWFQSVCHLILNNMCAAYRGALKFDHIDTKHCYSYVMFLRSKCPATCEDESTKPICTISLSNGNAVLFKNACAMEKANCNVDTMEDYEEVTMQVCTLYELYKIYGYSL